MPLRAVDGVKCGTPSLRMWIYGVYIVTDTITRMGITGDFPVKRESEYSLIRKFALGYRSGCVGVNETLAAP